MRIAFDCRMIDHPGIGRYIRNLLSAMIAEASDYKFTLYGDPKKLNSFNNCQIREHSAEIYSVKELFSNPFAEDKFDVVHIPHFNVPLKRPKNLVVTVHDLIYLRFPEFLPLLKRTAAAPLLSMALKKASRVIAVSENTKQDIMQAFKIAPEKIEVIYEAADPIFKRIDEERKERIKQKYNLPDDIFLFVGSLKKHKNLERLLDAYIDLKSRDIEHRLVIVGREGSEDIHEKINLTDAIYLGEVAEGDLPAIYNLSKLLVIPSLYEGFGLPALEAFACGVPVASSSLSSLPEVIGDAGILFNPYNAEDIADTICKVLKDDNRRQELIEKGFKAVKEFSWQKAAKETLKVYRNLL